MSGSRDREPKRTIGSPIRAPSKAIRPFQPYGRRIPVNQSPHSLLRAISQFPPQKSRLESMTIKPPTPKPTNKPLEAPVSGNIDDDYAEFDRKYRELKARQPKLPTRNNVHLDFIHRKMRHETRINDALSEISYHSDSNYSKLDYHSVVVEDDFVSVSTQDMLLDEDDDKIVLDTQEISHLQNKIDRDIDMAMEPVVTQHKIVSDTQETLNLEKMIDRQVVRTPIQQQPIVIQRKNKGKEKEVMPLPPVTFLDMVSPTPSPPPPNNNNNELLISTPDNNQPLTQIPDQTDNFSDYSAGGCEPTYSDEEGPAAPPSPQKQVDTDMDWGDDALQNWNVDDDEPINTEPKRKRKRVIPGENFISKRIESDSKGISIFTPKHLRDRFENFIPPDIGLRCPTKTIGKVCNLFLEQVIDDLLAYKKHQGDPDGDITDQDMILLMQRQRILNDKTTIESLAHKYLDRAHVDALCQHAEGYNVLVPSHQGIDLGSKYNFIDYLSQEEEEEEEEEEDEWGA